MAETAQDDMSLEEDIWVFLLDLSRVPMEAIACCHESEVTLREDFPSPQLPEPGACGACGRDRSMAGLVSCGFQFNETETTFMVVWVAPMIPDGSWKRLAREMWERKPQEQEEPKKEEAKQNWWEDKDWNGQKYRDRDTGWGRYGNQRWDNHRKDRRRDWWPRKDWQQSEPTSHSAGRGDFWGDS
ncbi:unnamed protein product [Symbiodinium sp. CCMP2592]|nr:unnamed protein product [Symbiodinium sp. CCMP2592]